MIEGDKEGEEDKVQRLYQRRLRTKDKADNRDKGDKGQKIQRTNEANGTKEMQPPKETKETNGQRRHTLKGNECDKEEKGVKENRR